MSEDWGLVTLPTSGDPEKIAIGRLKAASDMALKYYGTPLVVTTSGGKDSSVCVELARRAGIPFEIQHNHTTADAPETVRFVRQEFARLENLGVKCTINYPVYKGKRTSMWDLIPQKLMPPTRIMRYCCAVLKEQGGNGRFITTGVRWAESSRRKRDRGVFEAYTRNKENKIVLKGEEQEPSKIFEGCKVAAKRVVNPIVDWTDNQVYACCDTGGRSADKILFERKSHGWNFEPCIPAGQTVAGIAGDGYRWHERMVEAKPAGGGMTPPTP